MVLLSPREKKVFQCTEAATNKVKRGLGPSQGVN